MVCQKSTAANAAIGSSYLVDATKLKILRRNIGNKSNNHTRFTIISKKGKDHELGNKVTVIFRAKHKKGSLAKILTSIAKAGGNLTKIGSRPIAGSDWEYEFLVDIEIEGNNYREVLESIKSTTVNHRVIGRYDKGGVYSS